VRRLRPRFQVGLLGWIRGERVRQNLEILARVSEKLEQVATKQPVFQLWWVLQAPSSVFTAGSQSLSMAPWEPSHSHPSRQPASARKRPSRRTEVVA